MTYQIKSIPEGFHTITPHLVVKGASQAIEFYKKAFGAQELGRMPGPDGTSIMHAHLKIGDSNLFLNDEFPQMGSVGPENGTRSPVAIHLYLEDVDSVFSTALAAGAEQIMAPEEMFWGDRYGKLRDPFGHEWSLATHTRDLTSEEIRKGAQTAFCTE
jgi:PhnB protein